MAKKQHQPKHAFHNTFADRHPVSAETLNRFDQLARDRLTPRDSDAVTSRNLQLALTWNQEDES